MLVEYIKFCVSKLRMLNIQPKKCTVCLDFGGPLCSVKPYPLHDVGPENVVELFQCLDFLPSQSGCKYDFCLVEFGE